MSSQSGPCLEIEPGGKPGLKGSGVLGPLEIKMKHHGDPQALTTEESPVSHWAQLGRLTPELV